MDTDKRLTFSVREAAEALGLCENSLRERIRRAELPGVIRLGRRILISKEALQRYLACSEPGVNDTPPSTTSGDGRSK